MDVFAFSLGLAMEKIPEPPLVSGQGQHQILVSGEAIEDGGGLELAPDSHEGNVGLGLSGDFLAVEEDAPDLQIGRRRPPELGVCVQDCADARRVVVRAGTARDGVMVGGNDEGLRAAAEVEEEIRPFARPGRVTLDFIADAQVPEDRFEGLPKEFII